MSDTLKLLDGWMVFKLCVLIYFFGAVLEACILAWRRK